MDRSKSYLESKSIDSLRVYSLLAVVTKFRAVIVSKLFRTDEPGHSSPCPELTHLKQGRESLHLAFFALQDKHAASARLRFASRRALASAKSIQRYPELLCDGSKSLCLELHKCLLRLKTESVKNRVSLKMSPSKTESVKSIKTEGHTLSMPANFERVRRN